MIYLFWTKCDTEIFILGAMFTDKNNNTDNNNGNRKMITLALFYITQTELKVILIIVFLELVRFAFPFDIKEIQGTFEFVPAYLISLWYSRPLIITPSKRCEYKSYPSLSVLEKLKHHSNLFNIKGNCTICIGWLLMVQFFKKNSNKRSLGNQDQNFLISIINPELSKHPSWWIWQGKEKQNWSEVRILQRRRQMKRNQNLY